MQYIATALLVLMTITLMICGILLWKRRKEPDDHSRTIQAVLSWVSAFFTLTFIFRTWAGTTTADGAFLEPEHTFVPIFIQMCFFFYPLEVIKPSNRVRVYALLFTPLLLLVLIGMCTGIAYTPIYTYPDLWVHIGEFNVWFRLFALVVMLFYCFSLFLVPYDWRKSSANKKFIGLYSSGFCLIGLIHFCIQMSHSYVLVLVHQVVWIALFLLVAWYELKERLLSPKEVLESEETGACDAADGGLWGRIILLLDNDDKWRDPDLSLSALSEWLGSNRTYVSEAFKRETGMTFIAYLTKRRIDYVCDQLKKDLNSDVQELFNYVGYRQRSTAWRNFLKVTGVTPTEYLERLR